jgi:hypothetical protein
MARLVEAVARPGGTPDATPAWRLHHADAHHHGGSIFLGDQD